MFYSSYRVYLVLSDGWGQATEVRPDNSCAANVLVDTPLGSEGNCDKKVAKDVPVFSFTSSHSVTPTATFPWQRILGSYHKPTRTTKHLCRFVIWRNGNALDPYSRGTRFETRPLPSLLTYGAESFLRGCKLCSYSRTSQHFMEPEGSLPCSQEPDTGLYREISESHYIFRINYKIYLNVILRGNLLLAHPNGLCPSS
jgi:hypothetical protein